MEILLLIAIFIAGIVFGIVAPMVGIGGGLMYVPFLVFIITVSKDSTATFISSTVILFTSLSGSYSYLKSKRVDIRTGLIYSIFAIPGGFLGGWVGDVLITDNHTLRLIFAVAIGLTAIFNLYKIYKMNGAKASTTEEVEDIPKTGLAKIFAYTEKRHIVTPDGTTFDYTVKMGRGAAFSAAGGFVAGLLGLGGGIIYVPVLANLSSVPIHISVATSTFMIFFVTIGVLITRYFTFTGSFVEVLEIAPALALGAIIGAHIGAAKARKISSKKILSFFWIIAFLAAIRMIIT